VKDPIALDLKSDLRKHLENTSATRLGELTVADYRKAFALFCGERFEQSGKRRHAAPIDFDADRMDAVFDLVAEAKLSMLKGQHTAMPALIEKIAKVVIATVNDAVDTKIVEALGEIAYDRRVNDDDHHRYEYAAEGCAIRAEAAARWLDAVAGSQS